jgi:prepilin-type N-terminal cleavage/methylation domain-containing protein
MNLSRRTRAVARREVRRARKRTSRAGISLIEIMVVLAIMAVVLGIGIPSLAAIFDIQQRGAARELASTYGFLVNEAAMRNVTFRIAYHLDEGWYEIQVGDPDTLVFSDPETRARFEDERERDMKSITPSSGRDGNTAEGEGEEEESDALDRFRGLDSPGFQSKVELPTNSRYAFVYTPQYGEPQTPSDTPPEKPEDAKVVYSYVFANGVAEHTVVRIVDIGDPEDGFTVEVEPLSGRVSVESELRDIGESMTWIPDEAPSIR